MNYNNYSNENKYLSLAEASQLCSYSQEYLGLRARQGKLRAVKVGRDWMTTEHWLNDYINEIGTKVEIKKENDQKEIDRHISLREAAVNSPYSQDYLSLRVRQGKLRAVKHGRNWVTKKEWVDEYVKNVGGIVATEGIAENISEKLGKEAENKTIADSLAEKIDSTFIFHQAEAKKQVLPASTSLGGPIEQKFTESSIQWLKLKPRKGAGIIDEIKELAVRLNLKYKALDENLRILQVAPSLAGNSVKYLRFGVLAVLLIGGAWFLPQSQTGLKFAQGTFDALAKTGQMVSGLPETLISFQNKISAMPMKIAEAGDALMMEAKTSGLIISQATKASAGQTIETAKLFIWQGEKTIISLAAGSAKFVSGAPSVIKNWRELSSALNKKITFRILILPDQVAGIFSGAQESLATIGQTGNNILAASQNFFINWPAKVKNFYIGLDTNNEKFKDQLPKTIGWGINNFNLAVGGFVKNLSISNALSFAYDKYLIWNQAAGHAINDGAQFAYRSFSDALKVPGKLAVWTGHQLGGISQIIQEKLAAVSRNLAYAARRVGLTLSHATNFLTVNFTQYGHLANSIDGLFGKNIAQLPTFTPWQAGNIPFDEINQLQNEVNQLKIAMAELKFNLAIGQEANLTPTKTQPQPQYIVGPGGQITQNITQVQNITQNLPIGDYAKAGDLVATESRLLNMISTLQRGAVSQSNSYTTNNFYDWSGSQRVDNLGDVTIVNIALTGGLRQTGNGQIIFSGNVRADNGLDVSGANFTVGGNSFVVDNSGNLTMAGNLTVGGSQTLSGDLTVKGSSYLGSNTATSTLTVKGPSTFTVASTTEALYVTQYGIGAGIVVNASSSTSTLAVYQNGAGTALDIFQNNVAGNLIRLQNATGTLFLIDGFGQVTLGTTTVNSTFYGQNIITQLGDDNSLYNFILKNFSGTNLLTVNSGGNLQLNANATSSIFSDVAFDTDTLYIDSINNRVGIGTTSPLSTFSIQGTVAGQTNLFTIASSTGANLLAFNANGDLGIGTSSPVAKLSVIGNSYLFGNIYHDGNATTTGFYNIGQLLSVAGTGTSTFTDDVQISGQLEVAGKTFINSPLLLSDGTAVSPALSFTADQNLGLFRPAADELAISTGGSQRAVFDAAGQMGIGTTSPVATLHIVDATEQLRLGFNGQNYTSFVTGADGAITITPTNSATTTVTNALALIQPQVYFLNNGKIGFGTMAPNVHLEISTTTTQLRLAYNATNYTDFTAASDGALTIGTTNTGTTTITNALQAASSLYVLNNGLVGIQTTAPAYKLDVNGTLRTTGSVVLGDATTSDVIYVNSRVAGSLIPTSDNVLDLGDGMNCLRWRTSCFGMSVGIGGSTTSTGTDLLANGVYLIDAKSTLSINTTNNQPVVFGIGNVNIPYASSTALTVSGLASTTNLYVSGSAYLSQMIQGSVFFAGAEGLISQDNANLFWDNAAKKLGLNTATPLYALDTTGAGRFTSYIDAEYFVATSSTATSTFAGGLTVDTDGLVFDWQTNNVGIGTAAPAYKLDVNGTLRTTGSVVLGDATTSDVIYVNSRVAGSLIPTGDNVLDLGDGTNWLRWRTGYFGTSVGIGGTATSTGVDLLANGVYLIDAKSTLSINTTNNQPVVFGIGNVNIPYASSTALTVSGLASTTDIYISGSAYLSQMIQGSVFFAGANGLISQNNANLNWNDTSNLLSILGNASTTQIGSTGSAYFATSGGNVGVASTSPVARLSVVGDSYFTGNHYQQGNATTTGFQNIGQLLSVSGVGTSTFADNLQVGGDLEILGNQLLAGSQTITGDLFVNGNTTLGDASGDTLTFNASTLAIPNGLNVDSNTLFIDSASNRVGLNTNLPT